MESNKVIAKPVYILIAVVIVALLLVAVYLASSSGMATAVPVVAEGDNISVYYTLTLSNGTVFQSDFGQQPLNFTVGSGQMIAGFDRGVVGMKLNQTKTIMIPANQAYGEINPALFTEVPISDFGNQTVSVGMAVTDSSGRQGTITGKNSTTVTVDFNPALAGQNLTFTIKVLRIQKG